LLNLVILLEFVGMQNLVNSRAARTAEWLSLENYW